MQNNRMARGDCFMRDFNEADFNCRYLMVVVNKLKILPSYSLTASR